MKLVPGIKRGYADSFERALEIITHANLIQDHHNADPSDAKSEPCGVWPMGVQMEADSEYIATNLIELKALCEQGIAASPNGKVVIMEVECEVCGQDADGNDVKVCSEVIAQRIDCAGNCC